MFAKIMVEEKDRPGDEASAGVDSCSVPMEIISHVPQVVAQEGPKYKFYQFTNLFKGTHCKPECI